MYDVCDSCMYNGLLGCMGFVARVQLSVFPRVEPEGRHTIARGLQAHTLFEGHDTNFMGASMQGLALELLIMTSNSIISLLTNLVSVFFLLSGLSGYLDKLFVRR